MKQLREIIDENLSVLIEKSDGLMRIKGAPFMVANKVNKNNRYYDEALVKREVERLQKVIQKDEGILGSSDHPKGSSVEVDNTSHILRQVWYSEDDKTAYLNADILDTDKGLNIQKIIRAGGSKLGLSTRGVGTVKQKNGVDYVEDNFQLLGVDIVSAPSVSIAQFSKANILGESVEFEGDLAIDEEKDRANTEWQNKFMDKVRALYTSSREAGMRKMSLVEFAEKFPEKCNKLLLEDGE